ncbi:MAG: 2-dehydropantoate 2-reductase [Armatimonadota bacterium]|nr:2-dehydropantoate 2-reductase [Armatimonadota bacterium]
MKIAVYGAGGIGGYFGGRLALAGADVHLIARGVHLSALQEGGLRVRSIAGDFEIRLPATDDPRAIGPCDYVLFCVKSYDTESAAAHLHPLLHQNTAVLSLQNGIDNEKKIAQAIGWRHVMGGAAYIFATIAEPGVIVHNAGPGRIAFGEMDGTRSERAERFLALCREAGIPAEIREDIQVVLWEKFAFICAQAGVTATTRLPTGEIREIPETLEIFRRVVQEVMRVGRAEGIPLSEDLVDRCIATFRSLDPGAYSSLHHDLTHGRRMELEALHGTVVRLARKHGILVPMCEAIYAILKPWAARQEK